MLKNGKSPGMDGVTSEMLKYGGGMLECFLRRLFNVCMKCARVPEEWRKAVIVPLYKGKGDKFNCNSYRAISLLSVPGKLFARIVIDRVREITQGKIWDVQSGFMPGKGCADQIFALQQVVEKFGNARRKVYGAFVDLEKAYDNVDRRVLWECLSEYGVKGGLLNVLKAIYSDSKACVRINDGTSDWFTVGRGVKQGCVMSPWLFNVFMDKCIRLTCENEGGITVGGVPVQVLLYADDAVFLSETEQIGRAHV